MPKTPDRRRSANRRIALALAAVALAFFVAVIVKYRGVAQ